MSDDRLADLLLRWEELHEQGRDATPDELCRDCPELAEPLARRIEALEALRWMKEPLADVPTPDVGEGTPPAPTTLAGRYRLDRLAGEGGFGQVWKGYDLELERPVAVKVPKPSRRFSEEEIERFVAEARKVARLRHPGIVAVHDIHRSAGAYFFVSDWIEGNDLASRMRQGRLPRDQAVRIVTEVALALAYAHRQGIIHRDIKPGNILLDGNAAALVTDFGIAATEQELLHEPRSTPATLAYASPEQLSGQPIDTRSDLWSLGVVLHELLVGNLPFDDPDPAALREKIASHEPPPLRTVDGTIPPGLERICLKCLAKNPADRYATAQGLADDLAAHLGRRTRRWPGLLLGGIALLLAGALAGWIASRPGEAGRQRPPAEVRRWEVQGTRFTSVVFSPDGGRVLSGGMDGSVIVWDVETGAEVRRFPRQKVWVRCVAFSPDGLSAYSCCGGLDSDDFSLRRWDVEGGREIRSYTGQRKPLICLAVSPGERWLLSGGDGGDDCSLRLWDVRTGEQVRGFHGHEGHVCGVAFSPEQRWGISGGVDGTVRLWAVPSGQQVRTFVGHEGGVQCVAYGHNGARIVSGGKDGTVRLWNEQTAREVHRFEGHKDEVMSVAFSPDGGRILSGSLDGTVRLWDVAGLREIACLRGHLGGVNGVAFSPDGRRAVSGGEDGTIRLWRLPD